MKFNLLSSHPLTETITVKLHLLEQAVANFNDIRINNKEVTKVAC
jgi:hypothetical protein